MWFKQALKLLSCRLCEVRNRQRLQVRGSRWWHTTVTILRRRQRVGSASETEGVDFTSQFKAERRNQEGKKQFNLNIRKNIERFCKVALFLIPRFCATLSFGAFLRASERVDSTAPTSAHQTATCLDEAELTNTFSGFMSKQGDVHFTSRHVPR